MTTDDLNIEQTLSFSEQRDELIQGHQMEMQQVLASNRCLRDIIVRQQELIASKDNAIAQKDKLIAELHQRIADLEKPTTVNNTIEGNYYEQVQVNNMNVSSTIAPEQTESKNVLLSSDQHQISLCQTS